MHKNKWAIEQNKLELLIAIGFSFLILVLSGTEVGYIPMSPTTSIDMSIIPAVFAAMIGGYRVGIPVALVWAGVAFGNSASNQQTYTLLGLVVIRVVLVTAAYGSYKACKKWFAFSPANVYRAIVVAVTAKNVTSSLVLMYVLNRQNLFEVRSWMHYGFQQYLVELGICSLAMMFLIKHLRQIHVLNGVKRREREKTRKAARFNTSTK